MNPPKPEIITVRNHDQMETYLMIPNKVSGKRQAMADETGRPIDFAEEARKMPPHEANAFGQLMRRRAQFCADL